jgi:hypothetical protein
VLNANAPVWDWPAKADTKSTFVEYQYTCQNVCVRKMQEKGQTIAMLTESKFYAEIILL